MRLFQWGGQRSNAQPVGDPQVPEAVVESDRSAPLETISPEPKAPQAASPAPPNPSEPLKLPASPQRQKPWWWITCFAALGILSGMGSAALLWLVSLPPPPDCNDPASLTLDVEQLYCAQQAIQSGELAEIVAGLELLKQWTPDDPLYAETQKLAEDWSEKLLAIARDRVQQSDLQGALDAISHIPESTKVYAEAQEFVQYWQQQWQEGEAIYAKAQEALKQQNWSLASEQVAALAKLSNPYWNTKRANALAQQIGQEKQARQVLNRAKQAASAGTPESLGDAIKIAQGIPQDTHTWQQTQADLQQWSQTLVSIGIQRWQAGNFSGALDTFKTAPSTSSIPELQDLVRFSQAYKLAHPSMLSSAPSHGWFPSPKQIWSLMEAIAALKQVKPESPFYSQSQATQQDWHAQLQDLIQLQYATLAAKVNQESGLQLAIAQAQQISVDRPRRLQAQTLIAHWYEQIERLEDQPYLDYAMALAESGTVSDLQAAIAEASKIRQGRALRNQAQTQIAAWQDQIERIEDQPILDRAWALASQGQLGEAIEVAQTIVPDRILYDEAQSAIYEWQAELTRNAQIAEDRPILDRARSLADSGNLYEAVRVASQIAPGRVLYGEAQAAIATWEAQLRPPEPEFEFDDSLEPLDSDNYYPRDEKAVESEFGDELMRDPALPESRNLPDRPIPLDSLPSLDERFPPPGPSAIPPLPPPELTLPEIETAPPILESPPPASPREESFDAPLAEPEPEPSFNGDYNERYYESPYPSN